MFNGILPANNVTLNLLTQNNCTVKLSWKPGYGDETDHYIVQRQSEPSAGWMNIGTVKTRESAITAGNYNYTDLLNKSSSPSYRLLTGGKEVNNIIILQKGFL